MGRSVKIGDRHVGLGYPPYLIADIGANHDRALDRALDLIDLAAECGADAAKFQNFSAPRLVSRRGFEEIGQIGHQASWDRPVYEVYEAASIPSEWTPRLAERCALRDIDYLSTPYDLEAVDLIDPFVPAFKVGSGDVTYIELIQHAASKGKPVILSTGASSHEDVGRALMSLLPDGLKRVILLQCNSDYRVPEPETLHHQNLRVLEVWRAIFPSVPLGFSDHTPGSFAAVAAVGLGASVIEKHLTDDRTRPGPDHGFALDGAGWTDMAGQVLCAYMCLGDRAKNVEDNETEARVIQRRALRWACGLPAGHEVSSAHVYPTRPCPPSALEPWEVDKVVGARITRAVEPDELVRLEDFEA